MKQYNDSWIVRFLSNSNPTTLAHAPVRTWTAVRPPGQVPMLPGHPPLPPSVCGGRPGRRSAASGPPRLPRPRRTRQLASEKQGISIVKRKAIVIEARGILFVQKKNGRLAHKNVKKLAPCIPPPPSIHPSIHDKSCAHPRRRGSSIRCEPGGGTKAEQLALTKGWHSSIVGIDVESSKFMKVSLQRALPIGYRIDSFANNNWQCMRNNNIGWMWKIVSVSDDNLVVLCEIAEKKGGEEEASRPPSSKGLGIGRSTREPGTAAVTSSASKVLENHFDWEVVQQGQRTIIVSKRNVGNEPLAPIHPDVCIWQTRLCLFAATAYGSVASHPTISGPLTLWTSRSWRRSCGRFVSALSVHTMTSKECENS